MIRTAMNRVIAIALAGLALQGCADTSADPDRLRSFQVKAGPANCGEGTGCLPSTARR